MCTHTYVLIIFQPPTAVKVFLNKLMHLKNESHAGTLMPNRYSWSNESMLHILVPVDGTKLQYKNSREQTLSPPT